MTIISRIRPKNPVVAKICTSFFTYCLRVIEVRWRLREEKYLFGCIGRSSLYALRHRRFLNPRNFGSKNPSILLQCKCYLYCFTKLAPLAPTPTLPRWGREPDSSPQRGEVGRGVSVLTSQNSTATHQGRPMRSRSFNPHTSGTLQFRFWINFFVLPTTVLGPHLPVPPFRAYPSPMLSQSVPSSLSVLRTSRKIATSPIRAVSV